MLTRKDYAAIAKVIRGGTCVQILTPDEPSNYMTKHSVVMAIADYCEADNPNFDRDKFFNACYK